MSDTASSPGTKRGDLPTPDPHDVLMQMRSAEVGDWDELVPTGAWDVQWPFPLILGLAGARRIAAVGAAIADFTDEVLIGHVRGKGVLRIT